MVIATWQSGFFLAAVEGEWMKVHPTKKSSQLGWGDCGYYVVLDNLEDIAYSHEALSIVYENDRSLLYTVARVIEMMRLNR